MLSAELHKLHKHLVSASSLLLRRTGTKSLSTQMEENAAQRA